MAHVSERERNFKITIINVRICKKSEQHELVGYCDEQRELFKKANENDRNKIDKISGIKSPLGRIISKLDTAEKEFINLRQFNRNYTNIKSKKKNGVEGDRWKCLTFARQYQMV